MLWFLAFIFFCCRNSWGMKICFGADLLMMLGWLLMGVFSADGVADRSWAWPLFPMLVDLMGMAVACSLLNEK